MNNPLSTEIALKYWLVSLNIFKVYFQGLETALSPARNFLNLYRFLKKKKCLTFFSFAAVTDSVR